MIIEDNKALVLQFYQSFDDRKMEEAMNLLAPDFTAYMAGVPKPLDSGTWVNFRDCPRPGNGLRYRSCISIAWRMARL